MSIIDKSEYLIKRLLSKIDLIGEINGNLLGKPVYINDKQFGESTDYSTILEIDVNEEEKSSFLSSVGRIVKDSYFDFDFIFNVCFSCAKPEIFKDDKYADPYSIWFNVFLGYYQIDVPFSSRTYPFGFNEDLTINPAEILKIGKSDWNFFSNYLYGVPLKVIEDNNEAINLSQEEISSSSVETEKIHGLEFHKVTVNSFKVISAYEASEDRKLTEDFNNFVWQTLFGYSVSRKEFDKSFITTNMKSVMYVYHKDMSNDPDLPKEEKQHSTFIFGGVINLDYPQNALKNPDNTKTLQELESENNQFLELQLKEIRKIIPKVLGIQ